MTTQDLHNGLMDRTGADGRMTKASFDDGGVRCELRLDPAAQGDRCWTATFQGQDCGRKHVVNASSYERVLEHGRTFWAHHNRKADDFATWLLDATDELDKSYQEN